jgi:photosystem II stability/assembly factor-like uncharacterized protein
MTDDDLRDSFGDQLTDALRARSRPIPSATAAITVVSRVRRARTRRRIFTATLAAAVAASAVLVFSLRTHGTARINVAAGPSSTTSVPVGAVGPTGVVDWTWVSPDRGWALLRRPCGTTVCVALRATTDGGRTWTTVRIPRALYPYAQTDVATTCSARLCAFGVRFASARVGWLFGPGLLQTTDGGKSWARLPGPAVTDIETSDGVALRLSTTNWPDCAAGCTYQVGRQQLVTAPWQPVGPPISGRPSLIILRTLAYVVSVPGAGQPGPSVLRRSTDAGRTWTTMADPCAVANGDHVTTSASAAPAGVFAVLCSARQQPTSPFVRTSVDGGKTFGASRGVPIDTFGALRAASAETLIVGSSSTRANSVLVSSDGGSTWRTTLHAPRRTGDSLALGWETSQTARVTFDTPSIWTTRDAGAHWTRNAVAP